MKKNIFSKITLILCLLFITVFTNTLSAKAKNRTDSNFNIVSKSTINLIENNSEYIVGKDLLPIQATYLLDVNLEPNYVLLTLDNGGYIISTLDGKISEISTNNDSNPYLTCTDSKLVYAGAFNYYKLDNNILVNIKNNTILNTGFNNSIKEQNEYFLKENLENTSRASVPSGGGSLSWKGITSSRFSRYAGTGWINNDGYCGAYAAAVMMAYFDDYLNDNLIPSSVRTRGSSSPGSLITKLISLTPHVSETLPNHVSTGINSFINNYSTNKNIGTATNLYGTYTYVKLQCDNNRPICVGTISGDYGKHWITVYQYAESSSTKYYRCVDNWGEYDVYIDYSWTLGSVYLTNV